MTSAAYLPDAPSDALGPFAAHRRLLFDVAYRMLGSVVDAEDVLQDAWLSWDRADRSAVLNPRAYLVRTVTNLSLNRLTSARAARETYIGPWLPEPLLTETLPAGSLSAASLPTVPDGAEQVERAETVSTAMLVVLESLSPLERAVFVLREVFGYSYAEVAGVLDRAEATVRQTGHRARAHVRARRPRFATEPGQRREVTRRFLAACAGGDLNAVMELLAPGVTAWSDGGGKVTAARRPLHGADHVARWLLGMLAKPSLRAVTLESARVNGEESVVFVYGGVARAALTYDLDAVDGRVVNLRLQVNPEKVAGLAGLVGLGEPAGLVGRSVGGASGM
ncbi:RNA polymerase sigma factor SigJ [Streptomyces sp. NPDC058401]|uniref:RNA polymerase sigma factor SigJ n=1 Tax=Streptomyces sp. NPDC058401 TaxID=3346480 RepID=UPI003660F876